MSDAKPFAFSQLVPGFDFLKSLTGAAGGSSVPGLPSLSSWVAPTLNVEELDKRINELKTVQYWLEQNVHALKATIQALEVQKMTLSTLRGMNVRMEDLTQAFTRSATSAAEAVREATAPAAKAPTPEPAPAPAPVASAAPEATAPEPAAAEPAPKEDTGGAAGAGPGVIDPLQWWNSLTQQFQQIASSALQDAAQMKMPRAPGAGKAASSRAKAPAAGKTAPAKTAATRKAPARKAPVKKAAPRAAAGAKAPAAPRARSRR